jgi:hypothetical protein
LVLGYIGGQRKYMKRSKLMQHLDQAGIPLAGSTSPFKPTKNLDTYTNLINSHMSAESKLKQIRGGYVITAERQGTTTLKP